MKRGHIDVEGREYKVVESLGWQGGYYAKFVQTEHGERCAVRSPGGKVWQWYKPVLLIGGPVTGQHR